MSSDDECNEYDESYYPSDEEMYQDTRTAKSKPYEVEFESLNQDGVKALMRRDAENICEVLGVDISAANLLLRHTRWDTERLIERFMDNGTKVQVDAGVLPPELQSQSLGPGLVRALVSSSSPNLPISLSSFSRSLRSEHPYAFSKPSKTSKSIHLFACSICFTDGPPLHALSLGCQHTFCSECWTNYVMSKVVDDGQLSLRCMAEGCKLVIPDAFIESLLIPGPKAALDNRDEMAQGKVLTRFHQLSMYDFVSCKKNLKFCPYPPCENVVSCLSAVCNMGSPWFIRIVRCGPKMSWRQRGWGKVEHLFCFDCLLEGDHRPVACAVAEMWLKKCQDNEYKTLKEYRNNVQSVNWIRSNTKKCPRCHSAIEKNGGCNHMACTKCGHQFCWACLGLWSAHTRSCGNAGPVAPNPESSDSAGEIAEAERYLRYYLGWANHEQSVKLSLDLYTKAAHETMFMEINAALTLTSFEIHFLEEAVEELEKCRRTLMWTYPMAYYLADGNEKEMLEDNQQELERAVEELSKFIEGPFGHENISILRQQVINKAEYISKRNEILLKDTADGFLDGRWKWNVSVDGFDGPEPS